MAEWIQVAATGDVPPGEGRSFEVGGVPVALFNIEGRFFALANECPHSGGPLGEGFLEGQVITCPWHGWQFDVSSGVSPLNPAAKVPTYEVKVEDTIVYVKRA